MKLNRSLIIVFITMLVCSTVFSQTADEIISKHIEAIGGAAAWKKVNSMHMEGKLTVQGAEVNVALTSLHKKGMRQDISVMGMTGYQIVTPDSGWSFMPFQGQTTPEAMTADELKEASEELDVQGKLIDYASKGNKVELLGKEDVEGTECFKMKITTKAGNEETVFIDPASYYVIRSVTKRKANGQESNITTDLSNYQKLPEGIVVPMSMTLPIGELVFSKAEVNKPVDTSIFKPAK